LRSVHVLLIALPEMLSEIVREILSHEPGIAIAAEVADVSAAEVRPADVAIVGSDGEELPDPWEELLFEHPRMKVLTVSSDGRTTFLFELRPHREALGEVSPATLIDAVRAAGVRRG
jgi:hypothetical protein